MRESERERMRVRVSVRVGLKARFQDCFRVRARVREQLGITITMSVRFKSGNPTSRRANPLIWRTHSRGVYTSNMGSDRPEPDPTEQLPETQGHKGTMTQWHNDTRERAGREMLEIVQNSTKLLLDLRPTVTF